MADTDRIIHRNLWQVGDWMQNNMSSEHPQFPKEDTGTDTLSQYFRSRYGVGSGNGVFYIYAGNNKIDFNEGGGELTATLTNGYYNGQTLATEIKTQMEVTGALTYTVTYSETTAKFSISGSGSFTLLWNTGTNKATDISDSCGYSDAADDGPGAGPFVSDDRRIHWYYELLNKDLLTAYQYNFIALLNHNLSSSATITLYGADDSNFSVNPVSDIITYNANNIFFFLSAARTKRYIQIRVSDRENSSSYWQIGTVYLGNYWEPSRKRAKGHQQGVEDMSEYEESDSRSFYALEKPTLDTYYLSYPTIDMASKANAIDLLRTCGLTKAFVVCIDYETPNSYSYYVRNNEELVPTESVHLNFCNWALSIKEVV